MCSCHHAGIRDTDRGSLGRFWHMHGRTRSLQLEKQNAISKNENIDRRWEFATCERIGVRGLNYESLARLFEC